MHVLGEEEELSGLFIDLKKEQLRAACSWGGGRVSGIGSLISDA